jgi:acyl dehydratase
MAVDAALAETFRSYIGVAAHETLGELTAPLIRRYARAIGEEDPLYYDTEFARSVGLPDIMAPLNLIASVVCWDEGSSEAGLRPDGTEADGHHLPGVPTSGVRVMGGGEEMQFHGPACAGMRIELTTHLESVDERETRSGLMLILRYRNNYTDQDGNPITTTRRTVLLR